MLKEIKLMIHYGLGLMNLYWIERTETPINDAAVAIATLKDLKKTKLFFVDEPMQKSLRQKSTWAPGGIIIFQLCFKVIAYLFEITQCWQCFFKESTEKVSFLNTNSLYL